MEKHYVIFDGTSAYICDNSDVQILIEKQIEHEIHGPYNTMEEAEEQEDFLMLDI